MEALSGTITCAAPPKYSNARKCASSQFGIFSSRQPQAKTIPEYGSDATNTDTVVLVPVTGSKIAIFVPAQSTCIVCPGTWAIRIVNSLTSTYAPTI